MVNKIYIHNITTLFVFKICILLQLHSMIPLWGMARNNPYFGYNAISKTQLNMYFKTILTINSANIVFTL